MEDRKLRVFIVDDSESDREGYRRLLDSLGGKYEITLAEDGEEAIEVFRRDLETGKRFDCIVVDYFLPAINGVELLNRLSALSNEPLVAIVFTGAASSLSRAEAARSCAANYIEKRLFTTPRFLDEAIESAISSAKISAARASS